MMTAEHFRRYFELRLPNLALDGTQVSVCCPFHNDNRPSLSIKPDNGVWCCHAGCGDGGVIDFEQAFSHCSRDEARRNIDALLGERLLTTSNGRQPVARYRYTDARGKLLFEKLRYEPKQFCYRHEDAWGNWVWKKGDKRALYNLPKVVTAANIIYCEGEKDADNVSNALDSVDTGDKRFAVTTSGSVKDWRDEYAPCFKDREVVILPDNDEPGHQHAEQVAKAIYPFALGVKIVNLSGLPEKGDVSDYLESHSGEDLLSAICRTEILWNPPEEPEDNAPLRDDMPDAVLDGRLGEICQRRMKTSPLAYSWTSLVTIAGASPFLKYQGQSLRGNLYCALVGATDTGKSATWDRAIHVLGMDLLDPILLKGKFGSAEGLANDLKAAGTCVRLLAPDELSHLLEKCAIDRSGLPTFLTSAYYQDQQKGGTKKETWEVDCRLSIIGGIVESFFGESFGLASLGGLYDRFLFGLCPEPFQYSYYPPEGKPESISVTPPQVAYDVWEVRDQWRNEGISGRVAEIALKCAYICAAVDGRSILRGAELGPAYALATYQMRVRNVLQPNPGKNFDAQCANAIKAWLQQRAPDGRWVKCRDLSKGIHYERFGPGVFNRATAEFANGRRCRI